MGLRLVYLLMLWGAPVLFYGIQRQLKLPAFLAFFSTMLFLVYPVNEGLMVLRSIPHTLSKLSLLTAVFLSLEYRSNPTRLRLLGIWLALLFSVGSYESGYVIIAIVPLLWWHPRWSWRKFNLTLNWYLFPAATAAYLLLLYVTARDFYGRNQIGGNLDLGSTAIDLMGHYAGIVGQVYQHAFLGGWREAISELARSEWLAPTMLSLGLIGLVGDFSVARSGGAEIDTAAASGDFLHAWLDFF